MELLAHGGEHHEIGDGGWLVMTMATDSPLRSPERTPDQPSRERLGLGEAAPEEVLHRPPREAWPLARVLSALLMKMGRTGLLAQSRRGSQACKSGDPRSQNADKRLDLSL